MQIMQIPERPKKNEMNPTRALVRFRNTLYILGVDAGKSGGMIDFVYKYRVDNNGKT
jgi:hypothetical protein